jgi:hypothetical protein
VALGVERIGSVNPEQFKAFQEWRAAAQGSHACHTREGRRGCGPGAAGPRPRVRGIGVKRGLDDGPREEFGSGPSVGVPMAPAKRRAPAAASQNVRVREGTGEGLTGWVEACDRLFEEPHVRRDTENLAAQARGESDGSMCAETHGRAERASYRSGAGACAARLGNDGQNGLGLGMTEGGRVARVGAVEVDVGVLLELVFRARIELKDVVAMTSAQLTSGFLPTGILPTAGSASGVAVSDAPLATVMSAQALDREVPLT